MDQSSVLYEKTMRAVSLLYTSGLESQMKVEPRCREKIGAGGVTRMLS